jgi:hypothetical protein
MQTIISKVNELCDVIGWVTPQLQYETTRDNYIVCVCYVS